MNDSYRNLADLAVKARDSAYSPYSKVTVGAALLCRSGKIYLGANIENASYSLTVCAERVAIFKAILEGERDFVAIAVAGGPEKEPVSSPFPPCGACRQVIAEFGAPDMKVIAVDGGEYRVYDLKELLPLQFDGGYLP